MNTISKDGTCFTNLKLSPRFEAMMEDELGKFEESIGMEEIYKKE